MENLLVESVLGKYCRFRARPPRRMKYSFSAKSYRFLDAKLANL